MAKNKNRNKVQAQGKQNIHKFHQQAVDKKQTKAKKVYSQSAETIKAADLMLQTLSNTVSTAIDKQTLITIFFSLLLATSFAISEQERINLSQYGLAERENQLNISYNLSANQTFINFTDTNNGSVALGFPGTRILTAEDFIFDKPINVELKWDIQDFQGGDNDDYIRRPNTTIPREYEDIIGAKTLTVRGNAGNDIIEGPSYYPTKYGKAVSLRLVNNLDGGPGADHLYGGSNAVDIFKIDSYPDTDYIHNFESTFKPGSEYKHNGYDGYSRERNDQDYMDVSAHNITHLSQMTVSRANNGSDTRITMPNGKEVMLVNFSTDTMCQKGDHTNNYNYFTKQNNYYFIEDWQALNCSNLYKKLELHGPEQSYHFRTWGENKIDHLLLAPVNAKADFYPLRLKAEFPSGIWAYRYSIDISLTETYFKIYSRQARAFETSEDGLSIFNDINLRYNSRYFPANSSAVTLRARTPWLSQDYRINMSFDNGGEIIYTGNNYTLFIPNAVYAPNRTTEYDFDGVHTGWPQWLNRVNDSEGILLYGMPTDIDISNITIRINMRRMDGSRIEAINAEIIDLFVRQPPPLLTPLQAVTLGSVTTVGLFAAGCTLRNNYVTRNFQRVFKQRLDQFLHEKNNNQNKVNKNNDVKIDVIQTQLLTNAELPILKELFEDIFQHYIKIQPINPSIKNEHSASFFKSVTLKIWTSGFNQAILNKLLETIYDEIIDLKLKTIDFTQWNEVQRLNFVIEVAFSLVGKFKCGMNNYNGVKGYLRSYGYLTDTKTVLETAHPAAYRNILMTMLNNRKNVQVLDSLELLPTAKGSVVIEVEGLSQLRNLYISRPENDGGLRLGKLTRYQYEQAINLLIQQELYLFDKIAELTPETNPAEKKRL